MSALLHLGYAARSMPVRRPIRFAPLAITAVAAGVMFFAAVSAAPGIKRWRHGASIRVSIDPAHAPDGAAPLIERAMATWTGAADGRLRLSRAVPENADIHVRFLGPDDSLFGEAVPRLDEQTG